MSQVSADEAVHFLVHRVEEQAKTDSVPLTDVELKQLAFSEETATPKELAAAADFDAASDHANYEAKITRLLRHAFKSDKENGNLDIWQKHLDALRDRDVYVLVMVDEARIPRPKPRIPMMVARSALGFVRTLPPVVIAVAAVALCGFVYFFILPMRFGKGRTAPQIFGSLPDYLNVSDNTRAVLFVIWLVSLLLLWLSLRKQKSQ